MSGSEAETSHNIRERLRKFDEAFQTWVTEQTTQLETQYHTHVAFTQSANDEIAQLEAETKNEQESLRQQQLKYQEQQQELERLQAELKVLSESQTALPSRLAELKAKQSELTNTLRRKQLALEHASGVFESRLKAVKSEIALYRDVLGLSFDIVDGMLKVTMRDVDPRHPSAELSFLLILDEEGHYRVFSCRPQLPTLEDMTTELRNTGDFSYFIHSMRRAFRIYIQTNA